MAIRVTVDSTADIPPTRARELNITVVPLTVLFGDEAYRDGVDLDGETFYRKLTTSPVTPTTTAPPPALFEDTYRQMVKEGVTGVLALSLGSSLSSTYSSAVQAAKTVSAESGVPIEVIDSHTVSGGFGLPAEIVAREAAEGASLADLKAHAESLLSRVHLVAVLDTLEYLRRGGRIGRARALLGSLINVKPLLEVRDGQVLPLENVRTRGKAQDRLAQIIAAIGEIEAVGIVQSNPTVG
ncbi:MAG TPA: DegV family protein, partial [Ktedonobacterales bacterium]|nr:DegV family protein [Ktedonobacterales bacterium]